MEFEYDFGNFCSFLLINNLFFLLLIVALSFELLVVGFLLKLIKNYIITIGAYNFADGGKKTTSRNLQWSVHALISILKVCSI